MDEFTDEPTCPNCGEGLGEPPGPECPYCGKGITEIEGYAPPASVEEETMSAVHKTTAEEQDRMAGAALGGAIMGASLGGPGGAFLGGVVGLLLADNVNKSKRKQEELDETTGNTEDYL